MKTIEEKKAEIEEILFQNNKFQNNADYMNLPDKELIQIQFPELVSLNEGTIDAPIFWFHSVGGVQPYSIIAKQTPRPFYGIETRGFRTNREPLQGVQAMAAYYIHIIKSIQLKGPYELGGYSLGGLIAYEVTRQLQELGETVNSIVMLDTLDPSVMPLTKNIPFKSRLLQGVNFILAAKVIQDNDKLKQVLIHRDEVDWKKDNDEILEQLSMLAQNKGAFQTIEVLKANIIRNAKIQVNYQYERYTPYPLNKPEEVNCYYFRNKSGLFFGDLEPFYTTPDEKILVDHIDYWSEWEKYIPNMKIFDVDSSNHMVFFNEEHVCQEICNFCRELYASNS